MTSDEVLTAMKWTTLPVFCLTAARPSIIALAGANSKHEAVWMAKVTTQNKN